MCLIDPVGDVYACPFAIHETFLAGSVRDAGGFAGVWRESELFLELRSPHTAGACASCGLFDACRGGCMAAKFFTGLPLDGPDPECVLGHGEALLAEAGRAGRIPAPGADHSRRAPAPRADHRAEHRHPAPTMRTEHRRPARARTIPWPAWTSSADGRRLV